jgi:hypothetical protein
MATLLVGESVDMLGSRRCRPGGMHWQLKMPPWLHGGITKHKAWYARKKRGIPILSFSVTGVCLL